jgi:hypothetical protein
MVVSSSRCTTSTPTWAARTDAASELAAALAALPRRGDRPSRLVALQAALAPVLAAVSEGRAGAGTPVTPALAADAAAAVRAASGGAASTRSTGAGVTAAALAAPATTQARWTEALGHELLASAWRAWWRTRERGGVGGGGGRLAGDGGDVVGPDDDWRFGPAAAASLPTLAYAALVDGLGWEQPAGASLVVRGGPGEAAALVAAWPAPTLARLVVAVLQTAAADGGAGDAAAAAALTAFIGRAGEVEAEAVHAVTDAAARSVAAWLLQGRGGGGGAAAPPHLAAALDALLLAAPPPQPASPPSTSSLPALAAALEAAVSGGSAASPLGPAAWGPACQLRARLAIGGVVGTVSEVAPPPPPPPTDTPATLWRAMLAPGTGHALPPPCTAPLPTPSVALTAAALVDALPGAGPPRVAWPALEAAPGGAHPHAPARIAAAASLLGWRRSHGAVGAAAAELAVAAAGAEPSAAARAAALAAVGGPPSTPPPPCTRRARAAALSALATAANMCGAGDAAGASALASAAAAAALVDGGGALAALLAAGLTDRAAAPAAAAAIRDAGPLLWAWKALPSAAHPALLTLVATAPPAGGDEEEGGGRGPPPWTGPRAAAWVALASALAVSGLDDGAGPPLDPGALFQVAVSRAVGAWLDEGEEGGGSDLRPLPPPAAADAALRLGRRLLAAAAVSASPPPPASLRAAAAACLPSLLQLAALRYGPRACDAPPPATAALAAATAADAARLLGGCLPPAVRALPWRARLPVVPEGDGDDGEGSLPPSLVAPPPHDLAALARDALARAAVQRGGTPAPRLLASALAQAGAAASHAARWGAFLQALSLDAPAWAPEEADRVAAALPALVACVGGVGGGCGGEAAPPTHPRTPAAAGLALLCAVPAVVQAQSNSCGGGDDDGGDAFRALASTVRTALRACAAAAAADPAGEGSGALEAASGLASAYAGLACVDPAPSILAILGACKTGGVGPALLALGQGKESWARDATGGGREGWRGRPGCGGLGV